MLRCAKTHQRVGCLEGKVDIRSRGVGWPQANRKGFNGSLTHSPEAPQSPGRYRAPSVKFLH